MGWLGAAVRVAETVCSWTVRWVKSFRRAMVLVTAAVVVVLVVLSFRHGGLGVGEPVPVPPNPATQTTPEVVVSNSPLVPSLPPTASSSRGEGGIDLTTGAGWLAAELVKQLHIVEKTTPAVVDADNLITAHLQRVQELVVQARNIVSAAADRDDRFRMVPNAPGLWVEVTVGVDVVCVGPSTGSGFFEQTPGRCAPTESEIKFYESLLTARSGDDFAALLQPR